MHGLGRTILLCLGLASMGKNLFAAPYDVTQATADAKTANSTAKTYIGSKQALNNNAQKPLMGNTQMVAYDGTQFNGQIACASATPFFEMLVQPSPTGDINIQSITQDTNYDGIMDAAYTLPNVVSGVCANGIISCAAGTWTACMAYQWAASAGGLLTLNSVPLSAVGGCYCVNNHCGNNLVWNNLGTVMGDIAGGGIAAIVANKPALAVADVRIDGPVIKYYAKKMGSCADPTATDPIQYQSTPFSISGASATKASTAMAAPSPSALPAASVFSEQMASGVYQVVANSPLAADAATTTRDCQIKRQISLDEVTDADILAYNGGIGGITSCGSGCFNLILGQAVDNNLTGTCGLYRFDVSFWVLRPDRIVNATLVRALFDDHIQVSTNNELLWAHDAGWTDLSDTSYPPGTWFQQQWGFVDTTQYVCQINGLYYPTAADCSASCLWGCNQVVVSEVKLISTTPWCERSTNWDVNPNIDFTAKLQTAGPHDFKIRVAVADLGEGYAYAQVNVDNSCKALPDVIDNQCTAIETNPDCMLQQEIIDSVLTYSNYNPTGLVQLPSTTSLNGASCTVPVTRDWWQKNRRYVCKTNNHYDFSAAMERKANIDNSATATGFQDYRLNENGQWVHENSTMAMPDTGNAQTCMQTCKARKPRDLKPISGLGVADDQRNVTPSWDFVYHECEDNVCPLETGEELVKACACINEFGEATAIMQGMRMATKDMICTSGKSPTP